ncbi:MAG: HAD family phosphatase [Leptolyngbyaceae cyanobacterium CSU_1_3]|nr:HAD family phosphatase [Leptolyngbyaceae cyanobacterium CSU_1_3]
MQLDIRLLVLDIDGTIAGKSNAINESVLKAIRAAQAKGVQVAIATGRMYRSALRFHQTVGSTLPLVAYQGAWIQDPVTETVHRHWAVPRARVSALLDYFEQSELRSLLSVHFYINDQLYVRDVTPETQAYSERSGIQPIPVGDLRTTLAIEPTKVLALSDDTDLITNLLGSLQKQYTPAELYLTKSVATFFEATHPEATKGSAVRYLAEDLLGLQAENVMTIGDNFNDVEMLKYAGTGVAMGNAPEAVQTIAQWVAPSVEEDGAVAAIEKFLL